MSSEVLVSITNSVATVTLNRPKRGNALTPSMNQQFIKILSDLAKDPKVRILVLTGAGKYFCSGMDLGGAGDRVELEHSIKTALEVFDACYRFPKPVIARINGPALGGGVGLVFTTDIRIATDDAYFALPEAKRGLIPAIISQYLVPELGVQKTREYAMTGRNVQAAESTFLSSVVPSSSLDAKVNEYVQMLKKAAPGAIKSIKDLVHKVAKDAAHEARALEDVKAAFNAMMQSDEAKYGMHEFLNKREPNWDALLRTSKL
ncbi:EnoyL-CoA hydratase [Apophysomyces sp. BC1034]|nr:EnoyL-CoA hydratase [Apophysomyces sp. BC1015]KAG0180037.1 EnoyL-CoA hydratase [Apophysomyces sp. BC1021]KAG0191835.1 EnoyL-CoA hydratase [Apophysomyces sp. BC1034]